MQAGKQQLFDYATLEEELDADCAVELGQSFMNDGAQIVQLMEQAMSTKDQEGVRSSAHKVRGACRSISALPVEAAASALEDAAMAGDWSKIEDCFATTRPLFDALCDEIRAYLSRNAQ